MSKLSYDDKIRKTGARIASLCELFGDSMIANAILDRLIHHSHIINITAKSYRMKSVINNDEKNIKND